MLKLIKYEFRKTMFSKLVLLFITVLSEIAYLIGVFFKIDRMLQVGIFGLCMCAMVGIFYIGIESLLVFHRDLNTKQSYMLFLTPQSSYQILGAKVIENGVSIFLTGVFYLVLAAADFSIGVLYIGGVKEFLDLADRILSSINININIHIPELFAGLCVTLAAWLLMVVTGYFAIVLSATVFAGKKYSGFVSFILYLVINWICGMVLDRLPLRGDTLTSLYLTTCSVLVLVALMYAVSGWIMEKKLSV